MAAGARAAAAQAPADCTYTTCALRLQYRGLGDRRIVMGEGSVVADHGGIFSRKIPVFEARTDSVHVHYVHYRSDATRAGWLAILGATALSAGTAIDWDGPHGHKATKISFIASGIIVSAIANLNRSRSEEHLQRAIWLYNRDLGR